MNQCYRLIWNAGAQGWVAAAETARARGKHGTRVLQTLCTTLLLAHAGPSLAGAPPLPNQLPQGGQVVAGQAGIRQGANMLQVDQGSNRAAIDWASFNVGSAAQVQFNQPSTGSVVLNRVLGGEPSQIFGRISANGQVFLSNPGGVYFAPGAQVNVGALVATTQGMGNAEFMAGGSAFSRQGSNTPANAGVVNAGTLKAGLGGYIALLAPEVRNQGVILAQLGTVALAAGDAYTLQFKGQQLADVQVSPAALAALVDNAQAVQAPGGLIILSAQAANRLQGGVVNNSGRLEANALVHDGGTVRLAASSRITHSGSISADAGSAVGQGGRISLIAELGNPDSHTEVSGSLRAVGGSQGGDGGFIETSGATLHIAQSARIDTSAPQGQSGTWLIDPKDFTIGAGNTGTVNASGVPSGDISGATLGAALNNGNVTIASGLGSTVGGSGNVIVNDNVTWSRNTLTLTAARDVNINAIMTAGAVNDTGIAGTYARLALNAATANNGDAAVAGGRVNTAMGSGGFTGRVDFVKADGITPRGGIGLLSINGAPYTLLTSLGAEGSSTGLDLQGMANTSNYALAADIDASASATWTNKYVPGYLNAYFNGLGHTIRDLTVRGWGGLIQYQNIAASGISNVGMVGGSVTSYNNNYAGALVGYTYGTVSNTFNAGMSISSPYSYVGGLVGWLIGDMSNSFSTGTVLGVNNVGGLVGDLQPGASIDRGWSSGSVQGTGGTGVGGLVGYSYGLISNSYATGNITGTGGANYIGGLVGYHASGAISNSYAASFVTGPASTTGAFAGYSGGSVSNSFYDSSVNGSLAALGSGSTSGITGMITANMKLQANYTAATAANGNVNPGWNFNSIWALDPNFNNGYPYLGSAPTCIACAATQLLITLGSTSKVYGDANPLIPSYSISGLLTGDSLTSLIWGSLATPSLGVGTYAWGTSNLLLPSFSYASGHSASDYVIRWSNNALSVTPRSLTITADAKTKVYGSVDPALTYVLSNGNLVNGDSLSGALARTAGNNVGSYAINQNTLTAGANYAISYLGANLSITPASLSITSSAVSKTYDGNTSAAGTAMALSPLYYGDTLVGGTFTYADQNVGNNKTVNVSGVTVSDGNGGANYTVTYVPNTASTITARAITLSAASNTKTYDGNTSANALPTVTGGALQGTDTLSNLSEVYDSKNASTPNGRSLSVASYTLNDGNGGNNYSVTLATASGTINQRPITLSAFSNTKTYDGNTSASAVPTVTSGALQGTDAWSNLSEVYDSKNASAPNGRILSVAGYSLNDGNGGANYAVTLGTASGTINPASLSITSSAVSKTYDGTTSAAGTALALSTLYGTDSLAGGSFTFADKHVGTNKTVNVSGVAVSDGNGGANYTVSYVPNTASSIAARAITISAASNTKTYDGSTSASAVPTITNGALASGDTLLNASEVYDSRNASAPNGRTLSVNGYTLNDGNGGANYSVTLATAAGSINRANLAINGVTVSNKVYDGSTTAIWSGASVSALGSDLVTLVGGSAAFGDKNVGTNKAVTLTGYNLSGADAGNYNLVMPIGLTANISPASLAIGTSAVSKTYDGTTNAAGSALALSTLYGTDSISGGTFSFADKHTSAQSSAIALSTLYGSDAISGGSFAYANRNAGNNKTLNVSGVTVSDGNGGANYTVSYTPNTSSSITPAPLHISTSPVSKVYDGNTSANGSAIALSTLYGGDSISGGSFAFADKNVGSSKTVHVSGVAVNDGNGGGNYTVSYVPDTTSSISARALTLTAASDTKVYDGNTSSSATPTITSGALQGSDTLSGLSQEYDSKNASAPGGRTLSVSGYTLNDGNGGNNYALTLLTASGTINRRGLSLAGASGVDKVYDGSTNMPVGVAGYDPLQGVAASDNVLINGSPVYSSANAGARTVLQGSLALGGTDAANYSLDWTNGSGTIARAPLTMTADASGKVVFDSDPAFSAHYSGFVNGETAAVLSNPVVTRPRAGLDESAGVYANALVPSAASTNYTIAPVPASFTIAPVGQLMIRVANGSKVYGNSLPSLWAIDARYCPLSGCVGAGSIRTLSLTRTAGNSYNFDDGNGTQGSFDISTTATASTPVGTVPIKVSNFLASSPMNFSTEVTMDGTLSITQRTASLAASNVTKVYDGSLVAPATLSLTNRVGNDDVQISGYGQFADKNVGSNKAYTLGSLALSGNDAFNYFLSSTSLSGNDGSITPRTLNVVYTGINKVYDGNSSASVTTSDDRVAGDVLSVLRSASFASKDAGLAKPITVSGVSLSGADATNYSVAALGAANADITPRALHVVLAASDKAYDGNTDATLVLASDDRVAGDQLTISGSGSFASKNVGNNISVSIRPGVLGGSDAPNYLLALGGLRFSANITPRHLTVSSVQVADKVYDASVAASASGAVLRGLVGSETLLASVRSAQFSDPHAGSNKPVTLAFALADGSNGGLASNYLVDGQDTPSSASILRRPVQVSADAQTKQQGDMDPFLSYRTEPQGMGRGLLNGEQLAGLLGRASGEEPGAYPIHQGSLDDRHNPDYAIAFAAADLTIRANIQPPVPPQPRVPEPAPPAPEVPQEPPQPLADMPTVQGYKFTQQGIWVNLVSDPGAQTDGLITVYVPHTLLGLQQVLDFPLPSQLAARMEANAAVSLSTAQGEPLPGWLHYDRFNMRFVAADVPGDGLPLELLLGYGGKRWKLVLSQTERSAR